MLSVVCGTVGLFEVEVRLDDAMRTAYEAEGIPWIKRLAAEVTYDPRKFIANA